MTTALQVTFRLLSPPTLTLSLHPSLLLTSVQPAAEVWFCLVRLDMSQLPLNPHH